MKLEINLKKYFRLVIYIYFVVPFINESYVFASLPSLGPRLIVSCKAEELKIEVVKENLQRKAITVQSLKGKIKKQLSNIVLSHKFTKEMMGEYSTAVVVAQQLGLTDVDYIRVYIIDPQLRLKDNKIIIVFYDIDDDVLERVLITNNNWYKCDDE